MGCMAFESPCVVAITSRLYCAAICVPGLYLAIIHDELANLFFINFSRWYKVF
jgi:hypothetical protein